MKVFWVMKYFIVVDVVNSICIIVGIWNACYIDEGDLSRSMSILIKRIIEQMEARTWGSHSRGIVRVQIQKHSSMKCRVKTEFIMEQKYPSSECIIQVNHHQT